MNSTSGAISQTAQIPAQARCKHCLLPVPHERQSSQFCCGGCELVYKLINDHNLEYFYKLRDQTSEVPLSAAAPTASNFEFFNDPEFVSKNVHSVSKTENQLTLGVEGIHCAACVWLLESIPKVLPGVYEARVDFGHGRIQVRYGNDVKPSAIASVINSFGYLPSIASNRKTGGKSEYEKIFLIKLGVAAFAAGNTMMLAVSLYQGMFTGIEPEMKNFLNWANFVLTLPVVLYSATPFYRLAWGGLRSRRLHIDLPISLGIVLGFLASAYNTVVASGDAYFDSICMLVFLLLLGRWLQQRQLRKISSSTDLLPSLLPQTAWKLEDKKRREVLIDSILVGDIIEVPAGVRFAADGRILSGISQIDKSVLTGESRPQGCSVGDLVVAGTKNLSSTLVMRVEAVGAETRLGKIVGLVEQAVSQKSRLAQLTDRLSGSFVVGVLLLSSLTFLYWYSAGFLVALNHTLAMLVITCPCALAFAAPISIALGVFRASRAGLLISSPDAFENISRVTAVAFDKTGTLTEGNLKVIEQALYSHVDGRRIANGDPESALLSSLIAAMEQNIEHPISVPLLNHCGNDAGQWALELTKKTYIAGHGVEAIGAAGESYRLGSWRWLNALGIKETLEQLEFISNLREKGLSPVLLSYNGGVCGIFGLGDKLRPDSEELLAWLVAQGKQVEILSGDEMSVVSAVASELGIPARQARGGLTPEDKQVHLENLKAHSVVAMIGDGMNDAIALAAADVGIGISGGAEACLKVADVFLVKNDLSRLKTLFIGSIKIVKTIRINLALSILYNIGGAMLAFFGYVNPLVAALLMPISSFTVILIATSVKSFANESWK